MTQFEPHHLSVLIWSAAPTSSGKFRLGSSLLGGADVLGNAAFNNTDGGYEYVDFQPYVSEINIENSVSITNVQDGGGSLSAQIILNADFDLFKNSFLRIGSGVKIGLKNYVPSQTFVPFVFGALAKIETSVEAGNNFLSLIHI
jgi:hypothetical protein